LAATAEFTPEVFEGERYCGSLYAEREWYGCLALQGAGVVVEPVQLEAIIDNAFDDHMTALTENMVTDEEYAEELVFGTPKVRKIVDGRVVSKTGRSLYDVIETGAKHSKKLAEDDPTYQHQADRDEGDRLFMEVVDNLEVGEAAHIVSMDPKGWYETHPELCDSIGYREGMAIQHVAYRSGEDTMMMWTYAIKQSDPEAIAQIYQEDFQTVVHPDTNPDLWSRYVHRAKMPEQWVAQIGPRTLEKHTKLTGSSIQHYSVDEFMAENSEVIREVFDAYMPRIVRAVGTRENDAALQSLAQTILSTTGEGLKEEVRHQLMRVANSPTFDDDSGRLMKVMIRYATLEKLRTKIPAYKERIDRRSDSAGYSAASYQEATTYSFMPQVYAIPEYQLHQLNRTIAQEISVGVAARRSVGGCSGISLSDSTGDRLRDDITKDPYNDMFSRADNANLEDKTIDDEDEYGPLVFECTEGHTNKRPRGKLIDKCQTRSCKGSVGCG
jgi:hypothetical protein